GHHCRRLHRPEPHRPFDVDGDGCAVRPDHNPMSVTVRRLLVDQQGFTLAEILIAAVIMGLALVGLGTVVPIAGYGVQEGYNLSPAPSLAARKLEQAKTLPWVRSPATDCLGTSASSGAAPTAPAGGQCAAGAPNIPAGGAVTWLADESAVTNFPSYARN